MQQSNGIVDVMKFVSDRTVDLTKSNSVVGEPIIKDGMTIIPVSKLSVSFAGGGADIRDNKQARRNQPMGGGAKVDMVPVSFLVIKDNDVRIARVELNEKTTADRL